MNYNLDKGDTVLHLSVHSFTPILDGVPRTADIGFLYDPGRSREKEFCRKWRSGLAAGDENWRLRSNYPYRGIIPTGESVTDLSPLCGKNSLRSTILASSWK